MRQTVVTLLKHHRSMNRLSTAERARIIGSDRAGVVIFSPAALTTLLLLVAALFWAGRSPR